MYNIGNKVFTHEIYGFQTFGCYRKFIRTQQLYAQTNMIGIDLFSGAGGMTLGAKFAGIDVRYAVENDKNAGKTYAYNNKDVNLFNDDIRKVTQVPFERGDESLVVFGGPPCQGFSTSNRRTRSAENPNNWLFSEFIRVVQLFNPLPEWIVFENVKGFSETDEGTFLNKVVEQFAALGYTVSPHLLNAADFGVPQTRKRFFIIASLQGKKIEIQKPRIKLAVTVAEAFADLPPLEVGATENILPYSSAKSPKYAKLLRGKLTKSANHIVSNNSSSVLERYSHIPQGGNWENIPAELMANYTDRTRCHTGIYHRLHSDKPSITIGNYRKNMLIHPIQNRGLSVREAARLQSFPDCFEFQGSIGFQQQQVGNAVPPLLAKAVFETILNHSC